MLSDKRVWCEYDFPSKIGDSQAIVTNCCKVGIRSNMKNLEKPKNQIFNWNTLIFKLLARENILNAVNQTNLGAAVAPIQPYMWESRTMGALAGLVCHSQRLTAAANTGGACVQHHGYQRLEGQGPQISYRPRLWVVYTCYNKCSLQY